MCSILDFGAESSGPGLSATLSSIASMCCAERLVEGQQGGSRSPIASVSLRFLN